MGCSPQCGGLSLLGEGTNNLTGYLQIFRFTENVILLTRHRVSAESGVCFIKKGK